MINFQDVSLAEFLNDYWQKKPLIFRKALPQFINPLSPDELAGLALEEDVESRIVFETPEKTPQWHLKRGPFSEQDFATLPKTHWTLLVQGVDRLVPEVYGLLDQFNFIPQWRIDDVMISFATLQGSVGPHYDNYDVFLYQAQGRREWRLTTQECHPDNCIQDLELRIMNHFSVEECIVLEEGDMLYLPPHVGHYGISLSEECMTYSFGYRSYQGQEIVDSLSDYVSEADAFKALYQDPNWSHLKNTSELTPSSWQQAQKLLEQLIHNEALMQSWFGCFATRLDQHAEQQLPFPLEDDEIIALADFIKELRHGVPLMRDASCRFAYIGPQLYINGCAWETSEVSPELLALVANHRFLNSEQLLPYLDHKNNQSFIYELWTLQWLQIHNEI